MSGRTNGENVARVGCRASDAHGTRVACLMVDTYINVLIATETNINSTIDNLIKRSATTQNDYLFIMEQIYDYILKWVDTL